MKLLDRKTENRQELLTVEMEPAEIEASLDKAYHRLVKKADIPGFRKGKAPREVVERHLGKDALFEDAMYELLPKTTAAVIEENKIAVFAEPSIKVTRTEPLVFEATVPLTPDIKLGDYGSIKMKPPEVKIEDKAVDDIVDRLRHQCAEWETVERPAELNDLALIDVESSIEGAPFINEKGTQYQILAGYRFPAPGFAEALLGMKPGEEKEFKLKLAETYGDKEKAGKEVDFKVKLLENKKEKLPEVNDAFAKSVVPEVESMDALREQIRADLRRKAEEDARAEFEEKVLDALVEKSDIEFPPLLIDSELDRMLRQYVDRIKRSVQSEEEFNSILRMTSEDKLRENYRPQAIQHVKRNLAVTKLIEAEKLETADTEVDDYINNLVKDAGDKQEEQKTYLNSAASRNSLRWWLTTRKAVKLLVDKAQAD